LSFLGSSAWYGFVLVIVDDNAGFRDEVRALLEQHGISVVSGMSTYDEREYADLTESGRRVPRKDRPVSGDDPTSRRRSLAKGLDPTGLVRTIVGSARGLSEGSVRGARDGNWRVAVSLAHAPSKLEARFTAPMRWR
jgi:hypothetical protein